MKISIETHPDGRIETTLGPFGETMMMVPVSSLRGGGTYEKPSLSDLERARCGVVSAINDLRYGIGEPAQPKGAVQRAIESLTCAKQFLTVEDQP